MNRPILVSEEMLQKAREARLNQGTHEMEVSFSGEAGLQEAMIMCSKNPGHHNFIPIEKLSLELMPEILRYPSVLKFMQLKANETVRLHCPYTSFSRPDDYSFSKHKGSAMVRVGSGRVWSVYGKEIKTDIPCPFPDCKEVDGPHTVNGFLRIHTAKHVIFDDEEAQKTTVEFFYDSPQDRSKVVTARGYRVTDSDLDLDYCVMECVTHDAYLCSTLDNIRRQWSALWSEVKDLVNDKDISFVISHPHGCSKQFSIGKCLDREWGQVTEDQIWYKYTFNAATCPGSSGCPVWIPGRDGLFSGYAPHSGSEGKDVNKSAVWFFWKSSPGQ